MSSDVPGGLEFFEEGDSSTPFSAARINEHVTLLNALRNLEIENHEPTWAQGNVVFRKKDKTRPGAEGESATGVVEQFLVTNTGNDLIFGVRINQTWTFNDDPEDDTPTVTNSLSDVVVPIAKPFNLRRTPFDGETIDNKEYSYGSAHFRSVTILGPPTASGSRPAGAIWREPFENADATSQPIAFLERVWPEYIPNVSIIYAAKIKPGPVLRDKQLNVDGLGNPIDPTYYDAEYIDLNADARAWVPLLERIKVCVANADGSSSHKWIAIRASEPWEL